MDHSGIVSSHKRPNSLSRSPGGDQPGRWSSHDDNNREDAPDRKRPKRSSQIPRTVLSYAEDSLGFVSDLLNNASSDPLDINSYSNDRALFQALPSQTRPAHLNFGDQSFQTNNEATADSTVGTSISYTATDGTISPGSLSRQEFADTNDGPLLDSAPALEQFLPDAGYFDDYTTREWPSVSGDGLNIPGSTGLFGEHVLSEFVSGEEVIPESFADRHYENDLWEVGSPFFAANMYTVNERPDPIPWTPLTMQNPALKSKTDETSMQTAISAKESQPVVPPESRFINIKPLKKFPDSPSFRPYSTIIPGIQHSQPLSMSRSKPDLPVRPGIRKGPLSTPQKAGAFTMRKRGACLICRLSNIQCSIETPCKQCQKRHNRPQPLTQQSPPSLSTRVLCLRPPLAKYADVMFLDFVTLRYEKKVMVDLIKKTARFTTNKIPLEMSSGPEYPPIPFLATEFHCLDSKFLELDYVIPIQDTVNQCQTYTKSYAPPFGLYGVGSEELRLKCLAHIDSIISKKRHTGEASCGDISFITHYVLEAVNKYRKSIPENGSSILTKAVKITAMHYFMSRIITLTKNSAETAVKRLQRPQQLPFDEALQASRVLTSTLLNLQVKQAMLGPLRELTTEIFRDFEKAILKSRRDSTLWADNFCVLLCICMSIEAVQVLNDSISMALLRKNPKSAHDRTETFLKLENGPFKELMCLFHVAHKTQGAKGFNPLRFGFPIDADKKFTPQMTTLVNDIKRIMRDHDTELAKASQKPSFDNPMPDMLTHHMDFRKRNSGRLVSKFLLSFFQ